VVDWNDFLRGICVGLEPLTSRSIEKIVLSWLVSMI
jgi:hypothetical protein